MRRICVGQFEVRIFESTNDFYLLQNAQTGCGAHTAYCTDELSSGVKWSEREAYHFPPYSAEIKNEWSYTSIPLFTFTVRTETTFNLTSIYVHVSRPTSVLHFLTFLFSSTLLCFFLLIFALSLFHIFLSFPTLRTCSTHMHCFPLCVPLIKTLINIQLQV